MNHHPFQYLHNPEAMISSRQYLGKKKKILDPSFCKEKEKQKGLFFFYYWFKFFFFFHLEIQGTYYLEENCGIGEDSWESLGLQGDPTSPPQRQSVLGVHWKDWW